MGVSGSGKTSLGKALAERLGWDFFDADDFHPPENIAKMTAGIPLDDSDRATWLASLHEQLLSTLKADHHPVLACSALKQKYREQLLDGLEGIAIIYLKGAYEQIHARMSAREEHYMKPRMLQSQFADMEEPLHALTLDVSTPLDVMVETVIKTFLFA